ncbi:MAG: TRAM domain-containing protein [Myxococcota bacterium]
MNRPLGRKPSLVLDTEAGLATGGEAVARHPDGRVIFVRGAAPEERVRVRVVEDRRRFLRAEVEEVLRPGPTRVEPSCPVAARCGGCGLLHLSREGELQGKVGAGLETLRRVGRVDPDLLAAVPLWSGAEESVRIRARLAVQGTRVGFRAARSHEVIPVDRCRALHPVLDEARRALADTLAASTAGSAGEAWLVTNGRQVSGEVDPRGALELPASILEQEDLEIVDRGGRLWLHPRVFAQASAEGNDALLAAVEAALPDRGRLAVELHAGSGNFTRLLASRFERVVAVELSEAAVRRGRRAAPEAEWRVGTDAEGWREDGPDLLLVDPPRSGLSPEARGAIARARPENVLYVSCDVGTLARDLLEFSRLGVVVAGLQAFDLYPRTPHLEWLAALRRGDGEV